MRVVLTTESYLPYLSGVTVSVDALARGLRAIGHEVLVVAPRPARGAHVEPVGSPGPTPRYVWLPSYQPPAVVPPAYRMPLPDPVGGSAARGAGLRSRRDPRAFAIRHRPAGAAARSHDRCAARLHASHPLRRLRVTTSARWRSRQPPHRCVPAWLLARMRRHRGSLRGPGGARSVRASARTARIAGPRDPDRRRRGRHPRADRRRPATRPGLAVRRAGRRVARAARAREEPRHPVRRGSTGRSERSATAAPGGRRRRHPRRALRARAAKPDLAGRVHLHRQPPTARSAGSDRRRRPLPLHLADRDPGARPGGGVERRAARDRRRRAGRRRLGSRRDRRHHRARRAGRSRSSRGSAAAIADLAGADGRRSAMAERARADAGRFAVERRVAEVEALYRAVADGPV